MSRDPISILKTYQDDPKLGGIAKDALRFVEGASCTFLQSNSSKEGQSPLGVVRMYEIRMSHKKLTREKFTGLEESIESLRTSAVNVHLCAIETEKGFVSLWLADKTDVPVGIVISRFQL